MSQAKPVLLPVKISSQKIGPDGRPVFVNAALYNDREPAERGQRDKFPRASPLQAQDLAAQMEEAGSDHYGEADAHQPSPPATPEPAVQTFAPIEGLVDGGTSSDTAEDAKRPMVRFLKEAKTGKQYELEDPFEYRGVTYKEVLLRSPIGDMWVDYTEIAATYPGNFSIVIIWLVSRIPHEVIDQMSIDDKEGIIEEGFPFLPRRLRKRIEAATEAGAMMQKTLSSNTKA